MEWWEAPEWQERRPMEFPDRRGGPMRRLTLTTDPHMVRARNGQLRLTLKNRHPHERVRIHAGDRQTARA
jgi:hypothetical protein